MSEERLSDEIVEHWLLLGCGMVTDDECCELGRELLTLRARVAELEGRQAPKDVTDISHHFPDGVPETDRPLGDRERRELNAYRKMFRAAAKELRIVADALESPLDIEVPTLDQTPISDLPFSKTYAVRVINGLKNGGVSTIGELMMLTDSELMRMPNISRGSLNAIKQALAERGQYIPR